MKLLLVYPYNVKNDTNFEDSQAMIHQIKGTVFNIVFKVMLKAFEDFWCSLYLTI